MKSVKFFYVGINRFMYKHPFIKSCVHFTSLFCPWMVAIFYALFLLKIVIESQSGFYLLFIKPFLVLIITALLRILINRPRPYQKYPIKPLDEKQRNVLLPKEMDSIFAISKDIETFNILSKEKILKKDEKQIENKLKEIIY